MKATDEQIERVRQLTYTVTFPSDSVALAAVLSELTTLRANMASLVDSSIEPPRQVREERDRLRVLRDANEAEIRSLKSAYCPGYQWQVKQDPIFQDKPRRGWYCCDSSGMNYLHKDRRVTQGISDQELAFWPTEIEANLFLHEWLYGPPAALAKCK